MIACCESVESSTFSIWKFFSQTFQSLEEVFFPGGLLWKSKAFIECSVQDKIFMLWL